MLSVLSFLFVSYNPKVEAKNWQIQKHREGNTSSKRSLLFLSRGVESVSLQSKNNNRLLQTDVCSCSAALGCSSHIRLSGTLWTVAHQAPLSMEFSWPKYRSELACPPPGDLPDPGIKRASPALAGGCFTIETPGKPQLSKCCAPNPVLSFTCLNVITTLGCLPSFSR